MPRGTSPYDRIENIYDRQKVNRDFEGGYLPTKHGEDRYGFAYRLAYVRWLRNRGRVKAETDAELAEATGVGLPWLMKWKLRNDAPNDRVIIKQFAKGLGIDDDWLIDGHGVPPEPVLWGAWTIDTRPTYLRIAERLDLDVEMREPEKKTAPARSAAGGKKRKR